MPTRKCNWVRYTYADGVQKEMHAECRNLKVQDVLSEDYGKTLHTAKLVAMEWFVHVVQQ